MQPGVAQPAEVPHPEGAFDAELFVKAVELVITAMDISICFADFPTQAIGETTRTFRQLGIGYANLGALLMAAGLGYDSDGGRALAASITSVMTGTAYRRSAELAGVVGPYDGYARNAEAHRRVMRKHAAANDAVRTVNAIDKAVHKVATREWERGNAIGEKNGWRNAQASVLAPTGTIGFMMDCDTTGIEPDFSLVKFKKLVGGGSMQIVNQTIPVALRKLGYAQETIEAIVEYIAEHGHVVDAPGLKPEHYEVFDCAMGARAIRPMGHVRMMAACQPFLSGAISKTVNLPETATVEEIGDVYFQGWKLGLKALAVYRDNCKVGQPLSDAKAKGADAAVDATASEEKVRVEYRPIRKRLPKKPPEPDDLVQRRRWRGVSHGRVVPRRRPRRDLPEVRQAGVDPRRHDGRLLDRRSRSRCSTASRWRRSSRSSPTCGSSRPASPTTPTSGWRSRSSTTCSGGWRSTTSTSTPAPPTASTPPTSGPVRSRPAPTCRPRSRTTTSRTRWRHSPSPRRSTQAGRRRSRRRRSRPSRAPVEVHSSAELVEKLDRSGLGRADVLHLRHEDAPGRVLLRVRGLRDHVRLQLTVV